ncbi:MAG: mechanosensitive ion channel family protein [Myxococcota bacterium]|nr:mechanosensitive ion channel family protein [Myxococcota bacterium]
MLAFILLIFSGTTFAQVPDPSCATPRDAAASLLNWLQTDTWDPQKAATCLDLPESRSKEAPRLAIQLKQILDARAQYVPVESLPVDPEYTDDYGEHRLLPLPEFSVLVLEKKDDRWLYSDSTLNAVPSLYEQTFSRVLLELQRQLPPVFFSRVFSLHLWQYLYFFLLLATSWLIGRLAQYLLTTQVVRLTNRFRLLPNLTLLKRIRTPLTWFVIGLIFRWGVPDLQFGVRLTLFLVFLATTVLSLSVVVIANRIVDLVSDLFAKQAEQTDSKLDDQVIPLASRGVKAALWVLGFVFILQNVGVEITALLAGVSVGGVAVALAAQDTISNLFGSLTIFTDRPFQIGDWVVIDGSIEGVVEEVGFRSTRIRTFPDSQITVPNATVANSTVDNFGRRTFRRVKFDLGLRYDTPRDRIVAFRDQIRAYLDSKEVYAARSREVRFSGFGDSALNIMIYAFLDVPSYAVELDEKEMLYLEIMRIAEDLGVDFAFPSTSVYVESLPGRGQS